MLSKFQKIHLVFFFSFEESATEKGFQFRKFCFQFVIHTVFLYHMAQSAPRERAGHGIKPIWEKPTLQRLLRWCVFLKARTGKVVLPGKVVPGPIWKENVENLTARIERDCRIGKDHSKLLGSTYAKGSKWPKCFVANVHGKSEIVKPFPRLIWALAPRIVGCSALKSWITKLMNWLGESGETYSMIYSRNKATSRLIDMTF